MTEADANDGRSWLNGKLFPYRLEHRCDGHKGLNFLPSQTLGLRAPRAVLRAKGRITSTKTKLKKGDISNEPSQETFLARFDKRKGYKRKGYLDLRSACVIRDRTWTLITGGEVPLWLKKE